MQSLLVQIISGTTDRIIIKKMGKIVIRLKLVCFLLVLVINGVAATSCNNQGTQDSDKVAVTQNKKSVAKGKKVPSCVKVYRFGDFSPKMAEALVKELKKTFPEVILVEETLPLRQENYLKERNRYRAAGFFEDLKIRRNGDAAIGLTDRIIYHPNEISPTYGIMGLSPVGTYICVVSSKIPASGKTHSLDNFVKLSLHELGHSYGLHHCPDQKCYMVDAEHKLKFPSTIGFCKSCKAKLQSDGWNVK